MMKDSEGKWILFAVADGKQGSFWPIDARAHLAAKTHTLEPPDGTEVVAPPVAPESVQPPKVAVVQTFVAEDGSPPPTGSRRRHHPSPNG